jgi:hypothetical protein
MITFYPIEKLEALAKFLMIDLDSIQVWSDHSLTIGSADTIEYYVTKGKRKYGELLGRRNGFHIYASRD